MVCTQNSSQRLSTPFLSPSQPDSTSIYQAKVEALGNLEEDNNNLRLQSHWANFGLTFQRDNVYMAGGNYQHVVARLPEWGLASLGSRQGTMNYLLPRYPATRSGTSERCFFAYDTTVKGFDSLRSEVG